MTRRHATAALLLAGALAGCGSSSSGSSPSSYRSAVNKICAQSNAKITAQPASEASTAAGAEKLLGIQEQAVAQVKAVKPPSSLKSQVQSWLALIDQSAANANQLIAAVKASDKAQTQALESKAQSLNSQTNSQASALGLTECAKNPQPSGQ